jgi:hypothetical protein
MSGSTDGAGAGAGADLAAQLAERDAQLAALKDKTRTYIQRLQADHQAALQAEKATTQTLAVSSCTVCALYLRLADRTDSLVGRGGAACAGGCYG